MMAQATASSSSSITAYRDSGSDRNLDPAWKRTQLLPSYCCRMNPRPCLLASVQSRVGLRLSKNARVGLDVSDSLAAWNARSWSVVHMNSFLVLRRGRSGANRLAIASVLVDSWLVSPKKERRSVWLLDVGNLDMASVMDGSILYP